MWTLVILTVIFLYAMVGTWTYYNMSNWDTKSKIAYTILGSILVAGITYLLVANNQVILENVEIANTMNRVTVWLLAPLNTLIVLPAMASNLNKYKAEQIDKKQLRNRLVFCMFIWILILWAETFYLKDTKNMIQTMFQMKQWRQ